MSEQTPNSSDDLNGAEPSMEDILASIRKIISDDEPMAMESPEDVPVASVVEASEHDGLDDLMQDIRIDSNDLTSDAILDAELEEATSFAAEGESVDLNIDDVLASLDDDVSGFEAGNASSIKPDMHVPDDVDVDSLGLESLMSTSDIAEPNLISPDVSFETDEDDILAFLDADIPLVSEPATTFMDAAPVEAAHVLPALVATKMAAPDFAPADVLETVKEKTTADDDLEMDALLDDILMTPSDVEVEDSFLAEDVVQPETSFQNEPVEADFTADLSETEEMSDLDLVKSLMADLADDPDGFEEDEDLDALLAIPDVEGEAEVDELMSAFSGPASEAVEVSELEPEDDILGDILDMTIEDELQTHPDDIDIPDDVEMADMQADDLTSLDEILEAEQDNIAENALPVEDLALEELLVEDLPADDMQADDLPSLSDIAAAAEADAVAVETAIAPQAIAASAGLAAAVGGAALGATALTESSAETEAVNEVESAEIYAEPTHESHPTQETSMPVQAVKTDAILDDVTETATAGAFAQLNQVVEDKAIFSERGPRIGDLVQDALRPMLKEWLDSNLKGIVERAVAKEVKRISSGK